MVFPFLAIHHRLGNTESDTYFHLGCVRSSASRFRLNIFKIEVHLWRIPEIIDHGIFVFESFNSSDNWYTCSPILYNSVVTVHCAVYLIPSFQRYQLVSACFLSLLYKKIQDEIKFFIVCCSKRMNLRKSFFYGVYHQMLCTRFPHILESWPLPGFCSLQMRSLR